MRRVVPCQTGTLEHLLAWPGLADLAFVVVCAGTPEFFFAFLQERDQAPNAMPWTQHRSTVDPTETAN